MMVCLVCLMDMENVKTMKPWGNLYQEKHTERIDCKVPFFFLKTEFLIIGNISKYNLFRYLIKKSEVFPTQGN